MIWIKNDSPDPIPCPKLGCKPIAPGWTHVHTANLDRITEGNPLENLIPSTGPEQDQ